MNEDLIRVLLGPRAAGSSMEHPSRLYSYTLGREIPLETVVFNRNHEPLLVSVNAPAGALLDALRRDYPDLLWIHDRIRGRQPLYDCRRNVWTDLPARVGNTEPRRKLHTGFFFLALGATGLLLLLWALFGH